MVDIYDQIAVSNGFLYRCKHISDVLGGLEAFFSVFIPKVETCKVPVVYFLSGLTCTDENFITKAGAFNYAAKSQVALVVPDTSPRGANIPGEDDSWDLGTGAGFYVDATAEPWNKHYKMYSYILTELPQVVGHKFTAIDVRNASIMGHSMGGHGALVLALRNNNNYRSVSAFAPICHPIDCPWGQKAFDAYLGSHISEEAEKYDATCLIRQYGGTIMLPMLIDQGGNDKFLSSQLNYSKFEEAIRSLKNSKCTLRMQNEYDHSYYFISTFIPDHIAFHADYLWGRK